MAEKAQPTRYVSDLWLGAYYNVDRTTIWRWTREGRLPQPVKLSPGCTRWDMQKIEAANAA